MNKRAIFTAFVITLVIIFCHVPCGYSQDPQVGVIMSSDIPYFRDIHNEFTENLKLRGIKAHIIVQTPAPDVMAWINAARKFVILNMDVIVTYGSPATQAVLSETSKIPVVFAGVDENNRLGLQGKKATGVTSRVSIFSLLKNLKGIKNFTTLGIIYNSAERSTVHEVAEIERLSRQFSFKTVRFNIRNRGDIQMIKNVDALYITSSCAAAVSINDIVKIARQNKIPTASTMGGLEGEGVLLTLFTDPQIQGREVAQMLARILKGENPSSIPEEIPEKIHLVINLKEATALGIIVPFDILSVATRVIK